MQSILGETSRRPDISFYASGRIDITAHVARILELREGDVIDIVIDNNGEYLLFVRQRAGDFPGRFEAQVHATSKSSKRCRNFRCHSVRLCKAMLQASGCSFVARLPVGVASPVPQLGMTVMLITHHPLPR